MARPFSSSGYQRLGATVLVHHGDEGPPAITSIMSRHHLGANLHEDLLLTLGRERSDADE
jgi:hypothetical protein